MNLFDSSFLCLDIGRGCVRGIAHSVRSGKIDKSAMHSVDCFDTVFALKSVIDELERQIGAHFDSAYITGNFGQSAYNMSASRATWPGEHRITPSDLRGQLTKISPPDGLYPMHIIPLRYDTPTAHDIVSPIGHTDRQLISAFGVIYYPCDKMNEILGFLRRAHIQARGFFDSQYLMYSLQRAPKPTTMFIDFGCEFTTISIWTGRGPVWHSGIGIGGLYITNQISEKLNISFDDAERIKRNVASLIPQEMDRFTPADTAYDFSRADVNEIVLPCMVNIMGQLKNAVAATFAKYRPDKIVITGGGAETHNLCEFIENTFGVPTENAHADASIRALSDYIWAMESPHRAAYMARQERFEKICNKVHKFFFRAPKKKAPFVPILPSTLCFDMHNPTTYSLFQSGGISMIHVDIMDGFYVREMAGSINDLRYIRSQTNAHLHVHLMTESPSVWASDAIMAGANTIILSTNTSGLRAAVRSVRAAGRRVGIALNPDSPVSLLKPLLRDIDEVMIMAVPPGAAGQPFNKEVLKKISVLNAARKKYDLKLTISVDGGINTDTAQMCWAAGADLLVSGSYLAHSDDFPLSVQKLLPRSQKV